MPPAREVLTVFVDGQERSGITLYALRPSGAIDLLELPRDEWSASETRQFRLHGEGWEVVGWDLALSDWPRGNEWTEAIRRALGALVRGGAVVAWVGAEGLGVAQPPDLFDPDWMTGSVLAAMTSAGHFLCPTDPDLPIRPVDDEGLLLLRQHARGLADVSA